MLTIRDLCFTQFHIYLFHLILRVLFDLYTSINEIINNVDFNGKMCH